jgi:hypothetical protein
MADKFNGFFIYPIIGPRQICEDVPGLLVIKFGNNDILVFTDSAKVITLVAVHMQSPPPVSTSDRIGLKFG